MEDDRDRLVSRALGSRWSWLAMVMAGVVAMAGVAVAVVLFSHTFGTHTPPGGVLSTTCTPVAVQNSESNGLVGSVVWGCGTAEEALIVGQGTVTYAHTAPIGTGADQYTNLYIVKGPKPETIDNCVVGWAASRAIGTPASGSQTFAAGDVGDWWYCAEYTGLAQKAGFSVTWSQ
jgi:hypothetical protein